MTSNMLITILATNRITMPAAHHSVFTGRMPFLLPNQQHQSTEGTMIQTSHSVTAQLAVA